MTDPKEYIIKLMGDKIAQKTDFNEDKLEDATPCLIGEAAENPQDYVHLAADKGEQITIGRSSEKDITIDNQYISRDHGVISEVFYEHRGKNNASVDDEIVEEGDRERFSEEVTEIELVEDMDIKAYISQ